MAKSNQFARGRKGRRSSPKKKAYFKKRVGEPPAGALSLQQQMVAMQRLFPGFVLIHNHRGAFWRGELQPQEDGPCYRVRIEWHNPRAPRVFVESPYVPLHSPHHYRDGSLCLFFPKDRSWTPETFVAESIVPWTAQWLIFYELWLVTGKWFGPEAPHGRRATRRGK